MGIVTRALSHLFPFSSHRLAVTSILFCSFSQITLRIMITLLKKRYLVLLQLAHMASFGCVTETFCFSRRFNMSLVKRIAVTYGTFVTANYLSNYVLFPNKKLDYGFLNRLIGREVNTEWYDF